MNTSGGIDNLVLLQSAVETVKALKKKPMDAAARASLEEWLDEATAKLSGTGSEGHDSSMRASSLNKSPDPHSIVERLARQMADHQGYDDFSVLTDHAQQEYRDLATPAATIIAELQARVSDLEVDLGNSNYSNHLIDEEMGEWKSRALAAESEVSALKHDMERHLGIIAEQESSLSRIKEETIEAVIGVPTHVGLAGTHGSERKATAFRNEAIEAIRSLGSAGGAEKTAESGDSPSTKEGD